MSIAGYIFNSKIWLVLAIAFLVLFLGFFIHSTFIEPLPSAETKLNVATTKQEKPPPSPEGKVYEFNVDADKTWQKQTFLLNKGDDVWIDVGGCVIWNPEIGCTTTSTGTSGKQSFASQKDKEGYRFFVPNAPPGDLVMRVGGITYNLIKNNSSIKIKKSGTPFFVVNDHKKYIDDNSKAFSVKLIIKNKDNVE